MSQESEIMVEYGVQGRLRGAVARTILEFLKEEMDGPDRMVRRKSLKERLGFTGIGCCGATWLPSIGEPSLMDDEDELVVINMEPTTPDIGPTPARLGMNLAAALAAEREFREAEESTEITVGLCPSPFTAPTRHSTPKAGPTQSGMNLAAALEAERQFTEVGESTNGSSGLSLSPNEEGPNVGPIEPDSTAPGTPRRVSLMKLLEETKEETKVVLGNDSMCCVCMVRKKGAAFIPCGHTFCRVCSRELWLNRGTCPLCNRSIIEILDIY